MVLIKEYTYTWLTISRTSYCPNLGFNIALSSFEPAVLLHVPVEPSTVLLVLAQILALLGSLCQAIVIVTTRLVQRISIVQPVHLIT